MKHKSHFINLVALVAVLTCAMGISAYGFEVGGIFYSTTSSNTVKVTYNPDVSGWNDYSGDVVIPETVTYEGTTYTVNKIGWMAFGRCTGLTSVSLPNTLVDIDENAFTTCPSLTEITIPGLVTHIGPRAFSSCSSLRKITCLNPVPPTLDASVFITNHFSNAVLYVPSGSVSAYQSASQWSSFSNIQTVNYDFCVSGIYYKYRSGTSNAVKVTYRDEDFNHYSGNVTIPASVTYNGTSYNVTALDDYAFKDCSNMTSVSLPFSLDSIGRYAFMNCTRLTEVEIPNMVSEMGDAVFQSCSALKSLQFPASLTVIYSSMCRNCTALETLIIPSKVNNIYVSAFNNCTALKKVICFPASVPSMNYSSTFPSSVYSSATLYTVDGAQGYTSPNSYFNNFTTKKPYSELLDAALNTTGGTIHFTSTGDYPWLVKGEGSSAYAQSGNKSLSSSQSVLTAEVTVSAVTALSFDFKAWGEGSTNIWDKCSFYVNGVLQMTYGAYQNSSWETYSVELPAGTSTLEWRYTKDNSVNPTGDYFAIDNVRFSAPEAYACYTPSNTTLTFYYDDQRSSRSGTTYELGDWPGWFNDGTNANVTKAVITSTFANARPTSTSLWFYDMENLQSITGMQYLNTSEVTNMSWMFADCYLLESLDVSHFNTAKVTTMSYMFRGCRLLTSLDVSNFNTAKVTAMESMFDGMFALTSLDLSNFNTSQVTNMSCLFWDCRALTSLDVSSFNTSNVTNMSLMFSHCSKLTSLDVSSFNTAKVTDMQRMFETCELLTTLDLSSFNTAKVTNMWWMLRECTALTTIYVGNGWSTAAVTNSENMFRFSTNLVGGMGTTYDDDHLDKAYAHIDGGPSNPGYFTAFVSLDEALNVAGGTLHFVSTGNYRWTAVEEGGRVYAQSGNAGVASSTSVMTATVTVDEASTLSFDFKAWGEGNGTQYYDKCVFYINDEQQFKYADYQNDWETYSTDLEPGTYTLKWSYSKDGSVDPSGDFFAVDNVAITSASGPRGDVDNSGTVNIADVTALIDYLLSGNATGINLTAADVDNSGTVNIADVTALIDYLLAGAWN